MHKDTVISKIEVLENGCIQVQRAVYLVEEDGTRSLLKYHRVSYQPGDGIEGEDAAVQSHATVAWTPEVVQRHRERVRQDEARRNRNR